MAQTMPTMAPAQRVVAPDSSSSRQAFIDSDAAEAAEHRRPADWRARWSGTPGRDRLVFCRATSRLDTSSSSAMAITPQNEPISALLWAITPQSTCWPMMALIGHHKRQLAEARQEPGAAHRFVVDEAEQAHIENDQKAEKGDRQGEIVRAPTARAAEWRRRTAAPIRICGAVERRIQHLPSSTATA